MQPYEVMWTIINTGCKFFDLKDYIFVKFFIKGFYLTLQQILTSSPINIECLPVWLVNIESYQRVLRWNIISEKGEKLIHHHDQFKLTCSLFPGDILRGSQDSEHCTAVLCSPGRQSRSKSAPPPPPPCRGISLGVSQICRESPPWSLPPPWSPTQYSCCIHQHWISAWFSWFLWWFASAVLPLRSESQAPENQ